MAGNNKFMEYLRTVSWLFVVPVVIIILALIIFIPMLLLDIMIVFNIVFALAIFFIVLSLKNPTRFSLCPTAIIVSALLNLAVTISATRSILARGDAFCGRIILFVSSLAAGSSDFRLIVGLAIFTAIVAVHLKIIIRSVVRIAEVAARFTLDAMPGKQMAIDAELSNGVIDQKEHAARKKALQQETDFYGSMDGVMKYLSGHEKLKPFIFTGAIIGGIIINGVFIDAVRIYVPLIIGNGVLSMIPALFTSLVPLVLVFRSVTGLPK